MKAVLAAAASMVAVSPAAAQSPTTGHTGPINGRPSHEMFLPLPQDWRAHQEWQAISADYRVALRFAECVEKRRAGAALGFLNLKIDDPQLNADLRRLSRRNRGCTGEASMVAPLLLRAAAAEVTLRKRGGGPWRSVNPIGVPARIGSTAIKAISACEAANAPGEVATLWRTTPGSAGEASAAQSVERTASGCRDRDDARLSPTAKRIALLEATLARP